MIITDPHQHKEETRRKRGKKVEAQISNTDRMKHKGFEFPALLIRLFLWTSELHFSGEVYDRTDLKSPSASESSQKHSLGTFLLFRRCSSLLLCNDGDRNMTS